MSSLLNLGYDSSSDDGAQSPSGKATSATNIVAAPDVSIEVWSQFNSQFIFSLCPCVINWSYRICV